ncbi:rhodanese-like domain-containing protein [Shewanella sp. NIFS-20-20]|uniref:rhodanese-like domain-containing protein n=1 Tax=Shewanella sp. NIFS-20-20 TaxID=2853806 RepID=UPI001C48B5F9|nr:rhodanese-like domain-containing protein [Shewanella sp. NIFS-20-20]MBV7314994.1 rhodanese-like domain-containing protein [Shewanella sp. NIFS-20-20]
MRLLSVLQKVGLMFIAILSLSSTAQAADDLQAWDMIKDGALVIDVRTPEEFAQGHLADAINIPFEQIAQEFAQRDIAKDTEVVLYCRSGNRSGRAQQSLIEQGYTHTFNGGAYQNLVRIEPTK